MCLCTHYWRTATDRHCDTQCALCAHQSLLLVLGARFEKHCVLSYVVLFGCCWCRCYCCCCCSPPRPLRARAAVNLVMAAVMRRVAAVASVSKSRVSGLQCNHNTCPSQLSQSKPTHTRACSTHLPCAPGASSHVSLGSALSGMGVPAQLLYVCLDTVK